MYTQAFTLPQVSNEEQLKILSSLKNIQDGGIIGESKKTGEKRVIKLPSEEFAEALNFSVKQLATPGIVAISGVEFDCRFTPGANDFTINSEKYDTVKTWSSNGKTYVSLPAIGLLLNKHYNTKRYNFLVKNTW